MTGPDPAEPVDEVPASRDATRGAHRAVQRALATRESAYADDVQRLLDAGLAAMEESRGETGPRVADIVRRAGLSNQAFYRHFDSKDELVAAVVEAGVLRLVGYIEHRLSKQPDPEAKLRAWVEAVLSQATNPAGANATRAVLWNFRQLPAGIAHRSAPPELGETLLEPLRELGSPDPVRDSVAIQAAAFARLDEFLWDAPPTDEDVDHLVSFCLAAIRR
jgi:AcrR family transcriptional regulator